MTQQQLLNEIADILFANKATFTEDTPLASFPTWDSMSRMNLLVLLNTEFGIDVPYDFLGNVKTAKEILALAAGNFS
jgi:acyl carrier protein